jgi:hypothetical protein
VNLPKDDPEAAEAANSEVGRAEIDTLWAAFDAMAEDVLEIRSVLSNPPFSVRFRKRNGNGGKQ